MIRPAVNQNNVVIGAEPPPEIRRRDYSSATAAENDNPFSSIQRWHIRSRALRCLRSLVAETAIPTKRETAKISQPLLAPKRLLRPSVSGKLAAEAGCGAEKPQEQSVGHIFDPFHQISSLSDYAVRDPAELDRRFPPEPLAKEGVFLSQCIGCVEKRLRIGSRFTDQTHLP